ncbi:UNVERIFIED_CONTAM: hypothetical protein ABID98_002591 [Brevibacillus sp. OAP136]
MINQKRQAVQRLTHRRIGQMIDHIKSGQRGFDGKGAGAALFEKVGAFCDLH